MDSKQYQRAIDALAQTADRIVKSKRPAYTFGDSDVFKNFKSIAERAKLDPLQVWLIYWLKHVDSLTSFAADENIPQAEEITGRFADCLNYLQLGYGLAIDLGRIIPKEEEEDEPTS